MFKNLELDLCSSRYVLFFLLGIYSIAAGLLLFSAIEWRIRLLYLSAVIVGLAGSLYYHYFFLAKRAISRISWDGERWLLSCNDGIKEASLQPNSVVTSWLLLLRFRLQGSGDERVAMIFNDAADTNQLRRLRIFLRIIYPVISVQADS